MKKKHLCVLFIFFTGILVFLPACNSPTNNPTQKTPAQPTVDTPTPTFVATSKPSPTFTSKPTSRLSPSRTPSPTPVEHRIGIRYVNGSGEFYDKQDDSKFVPRGMNYARIDHILGGKNWHSTFDPALYDPNSIDLALQQMESDGYNVVRVFIDCCSVTGQAGSSKGGLNTTYMLKVVDFLQRAKSHQIYVILIIDGIPGLGGYNDILWSKWYPNISPSNLRYLTYEGLIAKQMFVTDFVRTIIDRQAPLDAIFAYDLTNELNYDTWEPPLSLSDGLVTTGNGKVYDMSKPEEKQKMVSDNLILWIDELRDSILHLDPTALVEVSFYSPLVTIESQSGDSHSGVIEAVVAESQADFIDLHPYPGKGFTLADYAHYYGISKDTARPILMGEFGVKMSAFDSAASAAQFLQDWQVESCQYGFDGWLLWTWDSEDGLWNALSQNGEIEQALAPANRPDPCQ